MYWRRDDDRGPGNPKGTGNDFTRDREERTCGNNYVCLLNKDKIGINTKMFFQHHLRLVFSIIHFNFA